jgi:hypothetical protein
MRDAVLETRIAHMLECHHAHLPPLPTYLGPAVGWLQRGDEVLASAHTRLDTVRLDQGIFQLLSRLDGRTPWPEGLAAANAALGAPTYDEATLTHLFRLGLLEARDPNEPDPPPGASITSAHRQPLDPEDALW